MPTKILVVDDSATMRRVLEMTFAGEGAQVVTADSGEVGASKAGDLLPDVVFADVSMPGVDGYELCRRVKTNPALARTAVIVMGSQHHPYDDGKGRAAGADDHISKPFDTQSVIDRVAQVLGRPRASAVGAPAAAPRPAPAQVAAPAAAPPPAPPARSPLSGRTMMGVQPAIPSPGMPAGRPAGGSSPNIPIPPAPLPVPAAPPAPVAARPAPAPAPVVAPAPAPVRQAPGAAVFSPVGDMANRLSGLGLTREQVEGVLALSREVIEQVVWEVVPDLAEQLIKEELKRLTAE